MKSLKKQIYILAGIACFGISGIASAEVMGEAQLGQCAPAAPGGLSGVTISATSITWDPATLGGTAGCFVTGSPTSITSTQPTVLSGQMGNILNLTAGGGAVNDFITFNGTTLDFVLTGFGATGALSTACDSTVGDSCIVAVGSPFELRNTTGGVTLDFTVLGSITDGGVLSTWSGLFTSQIAGQTTLGIQNEILGIGEPPMSISSTYSMSLNIAPTVVPTPEPALVSMLLLAGAGLIGIERKRSRKR